MLKSDSMTDMCVEPQGPSFAETRLSYEQSASFGGPSHTARLYNQKVTAMAGGSPSHSDQKGMCQLDSQLIDELSDFEDFSRPLLSEAELAPLSPSCLTIESLGVFPAAIDTDPSAKPPCIPAGAAVCSSKDKMYPGTPDVTPSSPRVASGSTSPT
eukprot:scaffold555265_cov48-Prasinocladus_malaysianus.AAC.1